MIEINNKSPYYFFFCISFNLCKNTSLNRIFGCFRRALIAEKSRNIISKYWLYFEIISENNI